MVVVAWGIYSAAKDKAEKSGKTAVADQEPDNEESDVITYNGKKYRYNTDLKTVLFLGVDKTQEAKVNSTQGTMARRIRSYYIFWIGKPRQQNGWQYPGIR